MSQSDTYTKLLGLIEALCGASFGATEQTRVQHLVNRRAWAAYRETDYWPSMLVIGEERAVDDSDPGSLIVPWTGNVYDETNTVHNPYAGTVDTFMRIHRERPWSNKSTGEYDFQATSAGARIVSNDIPYGLTVTPTATTTSLTQIRITIAGRVDAYVGGTIRLDDYTTLGDDDANQTYTLVAVLYIGGNTLLFANETFTQEITFLAGIGTVSFPSVFCTYKKRLNGTTYGASDTTAIPQEWFEYIAHGVFADMLRADQRFEAAQLEEANASMALQRELERIDRMHTIQTVGNRIKTHGTEQARESAHT